MVNKLNNPFGDVKLEFPVEWVFRFVVEAGKSELFLAGCRSFIEKFGIIDGVSEQRGSSGGKYKSYHLRVLFTDRAMMDVMSAEAGKLPGVKFVL
ncbi:MAG: DUF493 domain-containing protein [Lentisphaeria bacterium]|nr:DUF493 domain-containing protein [Lentisphaeria bacterium]